MFPNAMGMNNNMNGMGGGMMGMPNMGMGNPRMFNQFGGNNGMGMGGGMAGMPNMGMGNPGMFNQFNNGMPGMNMPNMGMQGMNNPFMAAQMNMNMAGQMPNLEGGNADWMAGYNMAMKENEVIQENAGDNKINVLFKTTQGIFANVLVDTKKTMGELLRIYLKRMGKEELINRKEGLGVCFLFNATKIDFSCNKTVEDFFHFGSNPTIIVNDVNNLIGA